MRQGLYLHIHLNNKQDNKKKCQPKICSFEHLQTTKNLEKQPRFWRPDDSDSRVLANDLSWAIESQLVQRSNERRRKESYESMWEMQWRPSLSSLVGRANPVATRQPPLSQQRSHGLRADPMRCTMLKCDLTPFIANRIWLKIKGLTFE